MMEMSRVQDHRIIDTDRKTVDQDQHRGTDKNEASGRDRFSSMAENKPKSQGEPDV